MSVTFSAEFKTTGRFTIKSWNDAASDFVPFAGPFASYDEAASNFRTACAAHGVDTLDAHISVEAAYPNAPEVNMANSRAMDLLMAMDLDPEGLCGGEDAEVFHARVLVALAQDRDDAEVPGFRDGNAYYGGRREGYVTERLEQLLEVAEFARAKGLRVTWG